MKKLDLDYTEYRDVPYLTEDAVKHATMPFLKSHYKYRSNLMSSELETGDFIQAQYDLRTEEGIEIDGLLRYKQRGGNDFVVTFEASCNASKEEVLYSVQDALLCWDGLATSAVFSTIILSALYVFSAIDIRYWGWDYMIFGLVILTLILTLAYMSLFRWVFQYVDRYHYIYAIEQFKKYHADEQWISVSSDIFKGPDDPYLEELKDQCVTNGFGLIEIQENGSPLLLITPARDEVFKSKRSLEQFVPSGEFAKRLLDNRYANALKRRFSKSRDLYLTLSRSRYERNYRLQIGVVAMASLLIGGLLWKELREPDIIQYDEADLAALHERDYDEFLRPEATPEDSIDRLNVQPFQEVEENYLDDNHEQPLFTLRSKKRKPKTMVRNEDFVPTPIYHPKEEEKETKEIGLYLFDSGEVIGEYPCERIVHENQIKYVVQEGIFRDKQAAVRRVSELAAEKISTNILSLHCFDVNNDSFLVFFEVLYDSLNVAETHLLLSEQKLQRVGDTLSSSHLTIRRLERDSLSQ